MKKITYNQYEYGDYVVVANGPAAIKGKVAKVIFHDAEDEYNDGVLLRFSDREYDTEDDNDLIGYQEYEDMDGEYCRADNLKLISKKEYDETVKKFNPHAVKGLPARVYFTKDQLVIGDNPISKAEAIKFANNILTQLKAKKK